MASFWRSTKPYRKLMLVMERQHKVYIDFMCFVLRVFGTRGSKSGSRGVPGGLCPKDYTGVRECEG